MIPTNIPNTTEDTRPRKIIRPHTTAPMSFPFELSFLISVYYVLAASDVSEVLTPSQATLLSDF